MCNLKNGATRIIDTPQRKCLVGLLSIFREDFSAMEAGLTTIGKKSWTGSDEHVIYDMEPITLASWNNPVSIGLGPL